MNDIHENFLTTEQFNKLHLQVVSALNIAKAMKVDNHIENDELNRVITHLEEAKYQLNLIEEKNNLSGTSER